MSGSCAVPAAAIGGVKFRWPLPISLVMNTVAVPPLNTCQRHPACAGGGFTLIELMISVAIVAALAAIAYPA